MTQRSIWREAAIGVRARAAVAAGVVLAIAAITQSVAPPPAVATAAPISGSGIIERGPTYSSEIRLDKHASVEAALYAYWTPERMKAAVRASEENPSLATEENLKASAARRTPEFPQVGRLFFTWTNGGSGTCTAFAIPGTNHHSNIATAAHCLEREGGTADNVVFMPDYRNGTAPFGRFTMRSRFHLVEWSPGALEYDIAVVRLNRNEQGLTLPNVVGRPMGLMINSPRARQVHVIGYPNDDYVECWAQSRNYQAGLSLLANSCNVAGGWSGGPWIETDSNLVIGLTVRGQARLGIAQYFDGTVHTLWRAA